MQTAAVEGETVQVHERIKEVPDVYSFDFDRTGLEKPWNVNAERNDEYFNYGFTEASFKEYQKKVIKHGE